MDFLFQKTWLPMFVSLFHLILLPLIVLCSRKKSDSSYVTPTQETGETASPSTVGNESGSKMTQEAKPEQPRKVVVRSEKMDSRSWTKNTVEEAGALSSTVAANKCRQFSRLKTKKNDERTKKMTKADQINEN